MFSSLALLDMCGEGCFILHVPSFRAKLQTDAQALSSPADASTVSAAYAAAVDASAAASATALFDESSASLCQVQPASSSGGGGGGSSLTSTEATLVIAAAAAAAAHYDGPQFVNVHLSLPAPQLCTGDVRARYRASLHRVVIDLLQQLDAAPSSDAAAAAAATTAAASSSGAPPRCLRLPLLADADAAAAVAADANAATHGAPSLSSSSLSAALSALSLTTLCGYLLDYPVLYCSEYCSRASTSSSAASAGNNLAMRPLTRYVAEVELAPGWTRQQLPFWPAAASTTAAAAVSVAAKSPPTSDTRMLVCSFTVPSDLTTSTSSGEPAVSAAIQRWVAGRLSTPLLHPSASCWRSRLAPLLLSTQSVLLPSVSL